MGSPDIGKKVVQKVFLTALKQNCSSPYWLNVDIHIVVLRN